MAKFTKRVAIWNLDAQQRARLQPGQHIEAGGVRGVYLGQKPGGTDVAMWEPNAKGRDRLAYMQALRAYAKG